METKTILVIDDEDFIATLISRALKKEGFSVIVTGDYVSSIKIIQNSKINLVVSDVMLPCSGGLDLLSHIKNTENLQHIPVILVTGMDKSSLPPEHEKAEAVIGKPFDMSHLVALVKSCLLPFVSEAN
jgi:CheY-like chemotaxis protein